MLACLVIPDYTAQVERLHAPARAPLLIVSGTRPAVTALDAQAGRCGARRGMSLKRAQALCPDAEVRPLVESRLREHFEGVLAIVSRFASRYEVQLPTKGADPALWLDLGAAPDASALAHQLRATLQAQTRAQAGIGLAPGKFTAFAAALAGGVRTIAPGGERAFLAPLPGDLLPLTADEARRLELYGLRTLGSLAALPRGAVVAQFGMRGRLLHQLASGEDPRPLNPYQPPPVERLSRRFSEPLASEEQFERALRELADEASARLQSRGAACGRLTLCLGYEDGGAQEQTHALREPLAARRDLFQALRRLGARLVRSAVFILDLELAALSAERPRQLRLFDEPKAKARNPRQLARALGPRHGSTPFVAALVPEQAELLPESITFVPLEGEL